MYHQLVYLSLYLAIYSTLFTNASPCPDCTSVNVTCVEGVCLPRCVSVKSSGECLQCRDSRFYGKQCENDCPHTCLNSTCQLNNSRVVCTDGCVAGKKGDNCGVDCPTSCTHCERYGEKCIGQCNNPQYYGDNCSRPCPSNCRGECDKNTGQCLACIPGYKGVNCIEPCRDGFDKATGQCTSIVVTTSGNLSSGEDSTGALGSSVVIPIGITLLVIAVLGSILLLGVFLWKRRKRLKKIGDYLDDDNSPQNNNNTYELRDKLCQTIIASSHANPTYGLTKDHALTCVSYCEELHCKESELHVDFTQTEFSKLPPPDSKVAKCGAQEQYSCKNRYRDVLPFDETRVVLQTGGGEESDYINASYINGYRNIIRYVAAQGPNLSTIDDFWRMIWQLDTTKIVMLTNLVEAGKVKCEMYWPFCSSEYQCYGEVCVQCLEEKVYQYYTLRQLAVWKGKSETRTVRQFHFTDWPDHGVPEDTKSIIDFHRVVKDTGPNSLGLMVVHCSAGVGRSGTFIALDYLLDQARYEGSVCIFKCLQEFRLQRMKMVQTKEQYKFVYDMLARSLQHRGTLPRYYSPVLLQCEMCWNKKHKTESCEDEDTMDENYQQLWNSSSEVRDRFLPVIPTSHACAIISEESPPLLMSPIEMELDSESDNEMEKLRISWVTAL